MARLAHTGVIAALLTAGGCETDTGESRKPTATMPSPIVPTSKPSAITARAEWVAALPPTQGSARPGDKVWATLPRDGVIPDVGVFTVDGIYDEMYSLTDAMSQRIDGVPPALVHPAAASGRLVEGMVVLFYTASTPGLLGRVSQLVPGGEINVSYDWGGTTRRAAVDHAQPPVTGVRPMAFVSYPKASSTSCGLLLALSETQGWVRTASGHVEVHPRPKLTALSVSRATKVGDRVRAYRWATGLRLGTVIEELEPGLRYSIKVDDTGAQHRYFFSSLFPL